MPIMFGFISMSFNSGLAIYFVISNIIGIGQGWYIRRSLAEERAQSELRRELSKQKAAELEEDSDSADGVDTTKSSSNGSGKSKSEKAKNNSSAKKNGSGPTPNVRSKRKKRNK
ncbi:MAG: hypothetical protein AAF633_15030, partial [Chloroflexota bacterium]